MSCYGRFSRFNRDLCVSPFGYQTSGIGKGCARALANEGATVYITGRNLATLEAAASELGDNCKPVVCDHAEETQIEKLFEQIREENSG